MTEQPAARRYLPVIRRYWMVLTTLAIGAVGGILLAVGSGAATSWVWGGYAAIIGLVEGVRMIRSLIDHRFGIDILAVLAIGSTVAVGEYLASMIIVLMLAGGRALEDFARGRAEAELSALLDREPRTAHRVTAHDQIEDVPIDSIVVGDHILVKSGEMVPVDGVLTSETAVVDLSSITGESMPIALHRNDSVASGAVNGSSVVTVAATAVAADSQYQGIVRLVRQAGANRAPVVRLADRFALPFTALALVIAGAAWYLSGDPRRAAEVLVLATPCPLVLAAPVAFIGGMSRAARAGIIVKGGAVLELLSRARTVVFDKTGTLTTGTPTVVATRPAGAESEATLLQYAASAERFSSHVLAASVARAAEAAGILLLPTRDVTEVEARGVDATVSGRRVSVGSLDFIRSRCEGADATALSGGELAIYVAIDGHFVGSIVAADPVRPNAASTIAQLRQQGIQSVHLLTGDAEPTARAVADRLAIIDVRWGCLPADKVTAIRAITERPVVMVGDGVNDAPVLAAADVGIAMGARGATAASESASAVIVTDDISSVATVASIGRRSVRIALQSMIIGIALSLALMLVAAFGFIPAVLGAALQELVDLATILNALRASRHHDEAGLSTRAHSVPRPTIAS